MSPGGRDDDDRGERPRRSWREIDRQRDGATRRDEPRPRGRQAEARSRRATQEYLKQIDGLFSADPGGAEGAKLAAAVREAHGGPGLHEACTAYLDGVGPPEDAAVAALFLDADAVPLVRAGLRGLEACRGRGELRLSSGLRSQLRMLAEHGDDEIAESAQALLED